MTAINPECAAGKCGNCDGQAWDADRDKPTRCAHHCHVTPRDHHARAAAELLADGHVREAQRHAALYRRAAS